MRNERILISASSSSHVDDPRSASNSKRAARDRVPGRRKTMNGTGARKVAAGVLAATRAGGGFAVGRAMARGAREPATTGAERPPAAVDAPRTTVGRPSFAGLVSEVEPAVVHINVT